MNDPSLAPDGARFRGLTALVLAISLVAALAVLFFVAKYAQAQAQTITIDPAKVGFGGVAVGAEPETRTITIRNTGSTDLVIGGVDFSGLGPELGTFTTSIDPAQGLTIGAGETGTFRVNFDPLTTGFKEATGTLTNLSGVEITGAPRVVVSGTGVTTQPSGASGDCTIFGTSRGEVLTGTRRADVICALGGNDQVSALGGNDKVRGGNGKDSLQSSNGIDTLSGGAGADRIIDKAGKRGDKLFGNGGTDTLNARDGRRSDLLNGGPGRDRVFKDRGDRARNI